MSLLNVFDIAGSGMSAQTVRMNTVSSNIANAESVSSNTDQTYRAREPIFKAQLQAAMSGQPFDFSAKQLDMGGGVQVQGIVESDAPLQMRYEPHHPMADDNGYVSYPNVNVVEEMANMISASRAFQTNVDVMSSAKTMMQQVLSLGR
ncbi:flagellar basal body rod protein FlgC [Ketobacter alkanivorans]|uniref:Flagellar basal-body rod protein FlgC n=1 Tax=Ketobacter alkanivorans TaxID=1917421 RepID=A0A2K9LHB5_9GAMM|nr:flagellar basal body rod protein FlgC [Ketobacter alkanivorans]AUM11653.1 flagellar basal body rod protein FlgC [Ketobacter alkanivorans]MCP5015267.1 flagellar basal body rod protein FlgC [Ketobacter sp.]